MFIAWSAAFAVACGDDSGPASDSGASPPMDASQDATVDDGAIDSGTDGGPSEGLDGSGGGFGNLMGEQCVIRIAAECDGPEDCPEDQCCGARFEPSEVSYTAISCSSECDFQRVFPLCHEGQICSASKDLKCRASFLIPGDFIGICALPIDPPRPPTGHAVEGMIDCGAQQCVVGSEQCCMREGYDVDVFQSVPHEPYCAPIGEACDCDDPPPYEGGIPGDDAGAD